MDDREGRRLARTRGLQITGTIGVLVEARERGLIDSLRNELDHLIEAGMWLDLENSSTAARTFVAAVPTL